MDTMYGKSEAVELPQVHFIWFGPFKPSSFVGPISIAQAHNDAGQQYKVTYWVDREQFEAAQETLKGHDNLQVACIQDAIAEYAQGDREKLDRINMLIKKCKSEELPTVLKEIVAPIILSKKSGFFFDTSIEAQDIVNLPVLSKPALPRNLANANKIKTITVPDLPLDHPDTHRQYKPLAANTTSIAIGTSTDLYAYYSAASEENEDEANANSQEIFSTLADKTIENWEDFFKQEIKLTLPLEHRHVEIMIKRHQMVNEVLMGAVSEVYAPHLADDKSVVLLHRTDGKLSQHDLATGAPKEEGICKFTVIDGFPLGTCEKGQGRELFCNGKTTGITKYLTGTWTKNFDAYLKRKAPPEEDTVHPQQTSPV